MSIKFYDDNADNFFNNTVNADMKNLYSQFEKYLKYNSGEILDLGCGSGRDSKYFIEKGFKVTALDLSPKLAEKASKYIGQKVIVGDMRDLKFDDKFIGIWACASLLHLNEEEVLTTLEKCISALKKDGILYASFKYGNNNYEKDGRTFTCFTEEKFTDFVANLKFEILAFFITEDVRADRKNEKWFNVIMKKI
ncbi:hypothetical protein IX317_000262 [Fusobacterium sp. DD29]|uniref:class I SAM-dependent methyltransferase n=1 Tax=unclassified Fusobacterium TaxID=2648384 RepID=UPI001B8B68E5|nr:MULTISPECIES: class I SAM-dependent methyltransferase [unclassified Fusobacterium]MBR8748603.1 hypothetical protein [Fusobacterium sp. DD29]MBR8760870.1 hypothetical protein [Fusobacterium sp. DD25]MBR8766882.1 hypothetical protein [Fusobacterium sp. DD43]MBR8770883.1 hypothetical protein [Fusobacterium sp. DD40]MBR8775103.1 hypothetical protein [Fusobacterium sp. DD17]